MKTTPTQSEQASGAKPRNKNLVLVGIVIIVLVVVGVAAYEIFGTGGGGPKGTQITMFDGNPTCSNVSPPNCGFRDANGGNSTTITSGSSVYWTNSGGQGHTATSCDSTNAAKYAYTCPQSNGSLPTFDTGVVGKGASGSSIALSTTGTYYYFCYIHSWMHGAIVVK